MTYEERIAECIEFLKAKNKYCWEEKPEHKRMSDYEYGFEYGEHFGWGQGCMEYLEWKYLTPHQDPSADK